MVLGMTTGLGLMAEKAPGRQKASRVSVVSLPVSTWPQTYDKAQYLASPRSWAGETRQSFRTSISQVGGEPNFGYSVHLWSLQARMVPRLIQLPSRGDAREGPPFSFCPVRRGAVWSRIQSSRCPQGAGRIKSFHGGMSIEVTALGWTGVEAWGQGQLGAKTCVEAEALLVTPLSILVVLPSGGRPATDFIGGLVSVAWCLGRGR